MNKRQEVSQHDRPSDAMRRRTKTLIGTGLVLMVLTGGLAQDGAGVAAPSSFASASETAALGSAVAKGRVDRATPTFSDPTSITNPLFPISALAQVLQLGADKDGSLRHEITLLPKSRTIEWRGQKVETLMSQFVAYQNGRILEVAVDYFAQAVDGSVWYFGEKVDNYDDGFIADHEGSWLAGRDGPPGMIMPADPKVGDVYRPENIPGLVFEEVTVKAVNLTVDGPRGPVEGAIRVQERLQDGSTEAKFFAPGYGEFRALHRAEEEEVTVALAVPIDALRGSSTAGLRVLSRGATKIFDATPSKNWGRISATLETMAAAWEEDRAGDIPTLLKKQMTDALDRLAAAVDAKKPAQARQAAINVAGASLDLLLRYRPVTTVDFDRLDLWARQLLVDGAADNRGDVAGDVASIEAIWNRVGHSARG